MKIDQIVSSGPELKTVNLDLDGDGIADLLFNAFNMDDPDIDGKYNGIYMENISPTLHIESIYVIKNTAFILMSISFVIAGLYEGELISPDLNFEFESWNAFGLPGSYDNKKYLDVQFSWPTIGFWYFSTFNKFPYREEIFIPLRLKKNTSGKYYYGWIRLKDKRNPATDVQSIEIIDMAINSMPDRSIKAGQRN